MEQGLDTSKIDDILFESVAGEHAIGMMAKVLFRALTNTDPGHFIEEMQRRGLNPNNSASWRRAINANLLSSEHSIDLLLMRLKKVALEEVERMAAFQHKKGGVDALEKLADAPNTERFIQQLLKR